MPSSPIHILFLGTSEFAVPSLAALLRDEAFVVDLVVTQPDRPVGRKQLMTPPPIKVLAERHNKTVIQPSKISQDLMSLAKIAKPDFLVAVSYGQILSQDILDLAAVAPINLHASLLPRWRGASPIHHAILEGDTETGVTVQRMVKKLDAGPILAQEKTEIHPRETFGSLHDRLSQIGAELLVKTLKDLPDETMQNERNVTICTKLTREDGLVDAKKMTAEEIDRTVRALVPWPGVVAEIAGKPIKLLETSLEETPTSTPLPCAKKTTLHIQSLQPPGKRPMTGKEWERGAR